MSATEVPQELTALAEKLRSEYRDSELAIAEALAEADEPLSIDALAEATGYTERTVKKRVDTLEERLGGAPLLRRDDADRPSLHPEVTAALRNTEDE
jgi:DNA-binding IclR family transcriptional regulator